MATQDQWRYCQKCQAMFFDGSTNKGVCPAGGGHDSQGFMFVLPHDVPSSPTAQDQWRFCDKCFQMFFDGNAATKGVCKAGGGHQAQGFMFVLPFNVPPSGAAQDQWRFCDKCFSLFFDGFPSKGVCPAGAAHHSQGFMFVLPHGDFIDATTRTFDSGNLTSDLPLQGSAHLVMTNAGDFTFTCHAHDSGFDNIHYALSAVLVSTRGIAFTFGRSAGIEGTSAGLPFGTPRRDDTFTQSGSNAAIKDEWAFLNGAKFAGKIAGADQLKAGLEGMLNDVANDVAKQLEDAAAKAIVALVESAV